jgi:hypothetical protein
MSNTTITISQLPPIGNAFTPSSILPVVQTTGVLSTDSASLGNLGNYILTQAGANLKPAYVSNFAYAVTNAAQPAITSVGNLTGLTVNGVTNLGNVGNVKIKGGTTGYYLQTDGNGNLAWVAGGGSGNGVVGGSNGQVQFNNAGSFGGDTGLIYDSGNQNLSTVNFFATSATIYGTVAAIDVTASGNITAGNLITGAFTSNGNITANHFIGNGSLLTGITATANGAGPNTAVQYNANGIFAGDANFAYDYANNILNVTKANLGNLIVSNSINGGNLVSANNIVANYFAGEGGNISNIKGANVNGAVGLSTYAGTANSVAVANVIGIGNIATVALNGSSSQVLYGNGQWAATASSYGNSNVAAFLENYGSNTITTTGNVTTGLLTVPASDNGSIVFSDNGTDNNGSLKVDGGLNMIVRANSNFYVKQAGQDRLAITDGNTDLMASTNVVIHSNKAGTENKWIFDNSGNLSLPGSVNYQVVGLGGNGHFDINSWYPVNISTGDGVNDAVSTWNFGYNGVLTFPGNFATIFADTGANQLNINSGGDGGGYVTINATTDTGIGGSQNVSILTNFGGSSNSYIWNFDNTGNLTTPGSIITGNGSGGNISGVDIITANYYLGDGSNLSNITGSNIIGADGNASNVLYGNGVFAAAPSGGGYGDSNVVTLLSSYGSNTITTTGNISAGNLNASANILGSGYGRFTGTFDESQASTYGMYLGYAGGTPRMMFGTGNTSQTFEIDNDSGNLRFYQPGSTKATLTSNGDWLPSGNVIANTYTKTTPVTVSALPSAATVGAGARAFVTDANSNQFANLATGGGIYNVPVFSNGTNWYVG